MNFVSDVFERKLEVLPRLEEVLEHPTHLLGPTYLPR